MWLDVGVIEFSYVEVLIVCVEYFEWFDLFDCIMVLFGVVFEVGLFIWLV